MSDSKVRVVHYLNQFFAGIGGEEQAGHPVEARPGAGWSPAAPCKPNSPVKARS